MRITGAQKMVQLYVRSLVSVLWYLSAMTQCMDLVQACSMLVFGALEERVAYLVVHGNGVHGKLIEQVEVILTMRE
jgi:hypothetical protein